MTAYGAKALRAGIQEISGKRAVIQPCQIHKQTNVLGHLPEHLHATVAKALREAWELSNTELAKRRLEKLASSLDANHS